MGVSSKHMGWRWAYPNTYLSVYVAGTEVARFDDATADLDLLLGNGLTITAGGLTITAGDLTLTAGVLSVDDTTQSSSTTTGSIHTDGGFGVAGAVNFGGTLNVTDEITFYDQLIHNAATVETLTQAKTLDAQDVGKIMCSALDSMVFTLPATAAGLTFTIVNTAADAAAKLSLSPHSDDMIIGIGSDSGDDKDFINTKTTAKTGDMIQVLGDGSVGWYVMAAHGTWAKET